MAQNILSNATRYDDLNIFLNSNIIEYTEKYIKNIDSNYVPRKNHALNKTVVCKELKICFQLDINMTLCEIVVPPNQEVFRDKIFKSVVNFMVKSINKFYNPKTANEMGFKLLFYVPEGSDASNEQWWEKVIKNKITWNKRGTVNETVLGVKLPYKHTKYVLPIVLNEEYGNLIKEPICTKCNPSCNNNTNGSGNRCNTNGGNWTFGDFGNANNNTGTNGFGIPDNQNNSNTGFNTGINNQNNTTGFNTGINNQNTNNNTGFNMSNSQNNNTGFNMSNSQNNNTGFNMSNSQNNNTGFNIPNNQNNTNNNTGFSMENNQNNNTGFNTNGFSIQNDQNNSNQNNNTGFNTNGFNMANNQNKQNNWSFDTSWSGNQNTNQNTNNNQMWNSSNKNNQGGFNSSGNTGWKFT